MTNQIRNYPFLIGLIYIIYLFILSVPANLQLGWPWYVSFQLAAMVAFPFVMGILAGWFWRERTRTEDDSEAMY